MTLKYWGLLILLNVLQNSTCIDSICSRTEYGRINSLYFNIIPVSYMWQKYSTVLIFFHSIMLDNGVMLLHHLIEQVSKP